MTNTAGASSDDENDGKLHIEDGISYPAEGSRRRGIVPLSSELGEQTVNKSSRSKSMPTKREPSRKGKEKAQDPRRTNGIRADVFETEEEESSPRKRKRSVVGDESEDEGDTSSWLNMDEDEAEPEFIAESEWKTRAFLRRMCR